MSNRNNLKQVDRLSKLPEPLLLQILSFLPTKFAVRTSLLSRRYRHLWTASPSMEFDRSEFPPGRLFNDVTWRCLRLRDPSAPLLSFCLKTNYLYRPFSIKFLSNWLNRAYSLGLRDLSLHIHTDTIESLFPLILSFGSLHSLCINGVDLAGKPNIFSSSFSFAPTSPLTQLKYLYIKARISDSDLKTFIMEQRNLEYLCIEAPAIYSVDLSSYPLILSFGSLHSLSFNGVDLTVNFRFRPLVPPTFPLTQLKYLYIKSRMSNSDLKTFIMQQRNLECLCIEAPPRDAVDLSSQSVKTLKLSSDFTCPKIYLSFPKLEFLDLSTSMFDHPNQFHGEMPVLRKALVDISSLQEECVPVLCDILKSITNVSELTLHTGTPYPKHIPAATRRRKLNGIDLFHPLVEPGKDMLMFPNLRSLKLSMCFYENALQDLICFLHYSPVIDSLHLIHVERLTNYQRTRWAPEVWHSKLPLNSEGNRKYADFSNLQTGDKKSEVIKLLSGEKSCKRLKT